MANPYAPPATAAFVMQAAELPPGMKRFRLDPIAFRALLRRRVWLRTPIILAMVALVVWLEDGAGIPIGLAAWFLPMWAVLALFIGWLRASSLAKRPVATYEVIVTERVARRIMAGVGPAEILRPEVSRIVETRWGLWVLCEGPRRSLGLVRAIQGYEELRQHLAGWAPVETLRGWAAFRALLAQGRRMGPRNLIAGTALETDPSLSAELGTVRALSSDRGEGYGGRLASRPLRTLLLWGVLIVLFLVIWQVLSPSETKPRSRGARSTPTTTPP
jgi:hypothetical protein